MTKQEQIIQDLLEGKYTGFDIVGKYIEIIIEDNIVEGKPAGSNLPKQCDEILNNSEETKNTLKDLVNATTGKELNDKITISELIPELTGYSSNEEENTADIITLAAYWGSILGLLIGYEIRTNKTLSRETIKEELRKTIDTLDMNTLW